MSASAPNRLAASREFMAVGEVAQLVLAGVWKAGVEQRFEPLGLNTARDMMLATLRRKNLFLRDGARALFDSVVDELVDAGALREVDGGALLLPILSADRLKVPKVTRSPEERASAEESERERAARGMYLKRRRDLGDTRPDEVIRAEYVYTPRRRRDDPRDAVTAPVTRAVTPSPTVTPTNNGPVTAASSSPSLSLHGDSSKGEGERVEPSETSQSPRASATNPAVTAPAVTDRGPVTTPGAPAGPVTAPAVTTGEAVTDATLERPLTDDARGREAVEVFRAAGDAWDPHVLPAEVTQLGALLRQLGVQREALVVCAAHWRSAAPSKLFHFGDGPRTTNKVSIDFLLANEGKFLRSVVNLAARWDDDRKRAEAEAARKRRELTPVVPRGGNGNGHAERAPPTAPEPRPGALKAEDVQAVRRGLRGHSTGTEGAE